MTKSKVTFAGFIYIKWDYEAEVVVGADVPPSLFDTCHTYRYCHGTPLPWYRSIHERQYEFIHETKVPAVVKLAAMVTT